MGIALQLMKRISLFETCIVTVFFFLTSYKIIVWFFFCTNKCRNRQDHAFHNIANLPCPHRLPLLFLIVMLYALPKWYVFLDKLCQTSNFSFPKKAFQQSMVVESNKHCSWAHLPSRPSQLQGASWYINDACYTYK